MAKELVDLTLQIHAKTANAIRVSDDGDNANAVWLPLSQVEVEETKTEGIVIVTMPEWLAQEKGLI